MPQQSHKPIEQFFRLLSLLFYRISQYCYTPQHFLCTYRAKDSSLLVDVCNSSRQSLPNESLVDSDQPQTLANFAKSKGEDEQRVAAPTPIQPKKRTSKVRAARRAQMKVSKDKKPTSKANGRASTKRTPSAPQTRQPLPADAPHRLSKQASTPQKPDERSPEPIAAQANTFTMIIGALTSVFVLIKAVLEARAARVAGMLAGGSLLCILISLAISPLNAPHEMMPWGETESFALVLQIAFA